MRVRIATFLMPCAMPPSANPARATPSVVAIEAPEEPGSLGCDRRERDGREPCRGNAASEQDCAGHHACGPDADQDAVAGLPGVEHVEDEEQLRRHRHREQRERGDAGREDDAQRAVGDERRETVARPAALAPHRRGGMAP